MNKIKRYLLLFSIPLIYLGCTKPFYCGKGSSLINSFLRISTFDIASNDYVYTENFLTTLFKRDSLKVINQNGTENMNVSFYSDSDPRNPNKRIYSIDIKNFFENSDSDAFNNEKTKKLYLKYYHNVVDTITITFKATSNKCSLESYEFAKIFYKNNLITEIKNADFLTLTLKR